MMAEVNASCMVIAKICQFLYLLPYTGAMLTAVRRGGLTSFRSVRSMIERQSALAVSSPKGGDLGLV